MILFPIVIIHGVHGDPIFLPIYCVNLLRRDEDSRNKRLRVKNNQAQRLDLTRSKKLLMNKSSK